MQTRVVIIGDVAEAAALRVQLAPTVDVAHLTTIDAVACARSHKADVLIMALADNANGEVDALAALHQAIQPHDVPILALVSRNRPELLVVAFDLGVADCAGLPVDGIELRARIGALRRRKLSTDKLSALARETERLALTDAVTGLFNRHYFDSILDSAVQRSRARGAPLAMLMLDIDLFKPVNDRFGHMAGDRALRAIAQQLGNNVRASDVVVRFGGDELLVLMPDTDLATAQRIAERLRLAVGETRLGLDVAALLLTVSIGISALDDHDPDGQALIARADSALYAAKRAGRNRVVTAASAAA